MKTPANGIKSLQVWQRAEIDRVSPPRNTRYLSLLGASTFIVLFWLFSIGDPCLIAFLRHVPPSTNPIAITTCVITETGWSLSPMAT
jgi:hypothetical protein